jgi:WD40 repeat protein
VFTNLTSAQQVAATQIFLRLVALGEGTEDTRRQALRSELVSVAGQASEEVITLFAQARLLTLAHDSSTRQATVEVAHEAIIREWSRLRLWLDGSRDDLRQQRLLAAAAEQWQQSNQDPSFLAIGSRLDQIADWAKSTLISLSKEEQAYLDASLHERQRQQALELSRQQKERQLELRAQSRMRIIVVVLAVSAIIGFILNGYALNQNQIARDARQQSERSAAESHEISLLSSAQLTLYRDRDTDLAIALALEAYKLGNLPVMDYRVLAESGYAPGTIQKIDLGNGQGYRLAIAPDGETIAVAQGAENNAVHIWRVGNKALSMTLTGHTDTVRDVAFSPDQSLIASAANDDTVRIWDAATGDLIELLDVFEDDTTSVAFSQDGSMLVTTTTDSFIHAWNTTNWEILWFIEPDNPETDEVEAHRGIIQQAIFSEDGQYLMSAGEDGLLLVWDPVSGDLLREFDHPSRLYDAQLSRDHNRLYTSCFDNVVRVWDFESGEMLFTMEGHSAAVYSIDLSEDETLALTASQDLSVRLWDTARGVELQRFVGHSDRVYMAEFLPGDRQFISSSWDASLRVWDVVPNDASLNVNGHDGTIYDAMITQDNDRIITSSRDFTVRVWDRETGDLLKEFTADDPETPDVREGHSDWVLSFILTPDERTLVSTTANGGVYVWDYDSTELIRVFATDNTETDDIEGHAPEEIVWNATIDADGQYLFTSSFDSTIIQWDLVTGEVVRQFVGHDGGVLGIRLIRDDSQMLTYSWDTTVKLWDIETGDNIRTYEGHTDWIWSIAVNNDETHFISASADTFLRLWDIETGTIIRTYAGHSDGALAVDFSPDSSMVVSGGRDNTIILWDVESGEWLRRYTEPTGWVRAVDFSDTENAFVAVGNDTAIHMWTVPNLDELVQWVRDNRYVRELTCAERELYRVEPECDG